MARVYPFAEGCCSSCCDCCDMTFISQSINNLYDKVYEVKDEVKDLSTKVDLFTFKDVIINLE